MVVTNYEDARDDSSSSSGRGEEKKFREQNEDREKLLKTLAMRGINYDRPLNLLIYVELFYGTREIGRDVEFSGWIWFSKVLIIFWQFF
jgi:hypothetical protein